MRAFAKAVLHLARYIRRIALALEGIQELYELDLRSRDIWRLDPRLKREESAVEISYGARVRVEGEPNPEYE